MGRMGLRLRVNRHVVCTLHINGLDYQGEIEDISLGGALVKLNNGVPNRMQPGCTCGLRLCGMQDVEYKCQVARFGSTAVGVRILEFHYRETVR